MIRILIIDDQKIVREGIKILLHESPEIEIVGDACDGKEGLEKIEHLKPDVVLLDINMPGISGLTVASKIRLQFPQVKTIMLSSHEDEKYVQKATKFGAKGYLLKNASSDEIEWSIKLVNQGYSAIKSELLEQQFAGSVLPESNLKNESKINRQQSSDSTAVLSDLDRENLDKLKILLANKEAGKRRAYYPPETIKKPRYKRRKSWIDRVKFSQAKKTIFSFEFRLLIFITLFCLGFLTFIALS